VKVGIDLAESFNNQENGDRAANILLELVSIVGPSEQALVRCLTQLRRAGRLKEIRQLVEQFRTFLPRSDKLLTEWARAEIRHSVTPPPDALLEPVSIDRIFRDDPATAVELLAKAGSSDDAQALLPRLLELEVARGGIDELENVGSLFASLGQSEEFEKAVRGRLPGSMAEHVLAQIKHNRPKHRLLR
jgi:hypothetical protein